MIPNNYCTDLIQFNEAKLAEFNPFNAVNECQEAGPLNAAN